LKKDDVASTKYGRITNHEWLMEEQRRVEIASNRLCEIKNDGLEEEALFYIRSIK
jgi:hypothetical protein